MIYRPGKTLTVSRFPSRHRQARLLRPGRRPQQPLRKPLDLPAALIQPVQHFLELCNTAFQRIGRFVDALDRIDAPAQLLARYGRENLEEVFLDVARGRKQSEAAQ